MFVVAIVSCPIALVFASLLWYLSCTDINCFYTLIYIIQPRHDIILHTTLFFIIYYVLYMSTCIKKYVYCYLFAKQSDIFLL